MPNKNPSESLDARSEEDEEDPHDCCLLYSIARKSYGEFLYLIIKQLCFIDILLVSG